MNGLDWVILALLGLSAINGYRRGAALQLTAYAGLLLGLLLGALVAPAVAGWAESSLGRAGIALAAFLAIAAIGDAIGWYVGSRMWAATRRSAFGAVDAAAGSLVALVALLLATWFIGFNLVNGPVPAVSREIRGSSIIRGLDRVLPRPPSLLANVRQLLNRFGFPEVFAGLPPAPVGPVRGPTRGEAARLARSAGSSTVRIVGRACGGIQEGTGFVGARNYVVTNAHVVAGMRSAQVQQQNGGSQAGTVVLFDPRLDVAVLHVQTSPGPPLTLTLEEEGRGTRGAVLGYPGGGALTFGPAAVRRELRATGRDIYGDALVERDLYELQAVIRPGHSGGPFVLADGTVAGVVFAASTADPRIGYAVTSPDVLQRLNRARARSSPVSTGACVP